MPFLKKYLCKFLLIAFFVCLPILSLAQVRGGAPIAPTDPCEEGKLCNPLGIDGPDSIPEFIRIVLQGILKIGMPIVALAIIYCGFLFVAARGKPEAINKAKTALFYTIIGAAILLGSWAIAELIAETINAL